jgi:porphobilinogen deaminase
VYCQPASNGWNVVGVVALPDGSQILREQLELHQDRPSADDAGRAMANRLLARGAAAFLATAETAPPAGNPAR